MTDEPILILGAGIMGGPMAQNLAKNGRRVQLWNRTFAKSEALKSDLITPIADLADLATAKRIVVVMLSTGAVVDEVLMSDAVMSRLAKGSLVIVMSSIPVATAKAQAARLAEIGVDYIDAPVSGGERGAIDASLTIMAGGEPEVIEGAKDIFSCFGRVTRVGGTGCGQLAKLANQTIVGISIGAVAEAFLIARQGGVDLASLREALSGGFADSRILQEHGARMISGNFTPGAFCHVQLKDLTTADAFLQESGGGALPILTLVKSLYADMCAGGRAELDHSGLFVELTDYINKDKTIA